MDNDFASGSYVLSEYFLAKKKLFQAFAKGLLIEWRFIAGTNLSVGLLSVLFLLFVKQPSFEAKVSIMPDFGSRGPSVGVSALISLAGIGDFSAPTEVYENLVLSDAILQPVLLLQYQAVSLGRTGNLLELLEIGRDDSQPTEVLRERARTIAGIAALRERVATSIDRSTKILTITVTMPDGQLAADVANALVSSLDNYVRSKRKSYASNQVDYLGSRLKEVADSLAAAEEALRRFRDDNRIVGQSPGLLLQQARLVRSVEILQTVYGELYKQMEVARIEEIRDTPVINLREPAENGLYPAGPRRLVILVAVMFFSGFLTIIWLRVRPLVKRVIDG
jgi:uncharacterized protein involved in exopolysaccharide biosynthesis